MTTDDAATIAAALGTEVPAVVAGLLGYNAEPPTWPYEVEGNPIPVTLFGKDHYEAFLYVETRCVDNKGSLKHDHLRCNTSRHPVMAAASTRIGPVGNINYSTRIKESWKRGADGKHGFVEIEDHDDYDCLLDMRAAGWLQVAMPIQRDGVFLDVFERAATHRDGTPIAANFVTGLDEKVLATYAKWSLTDRGWEVAGQLRRWRAEGGTMHSFEPAYASCGAAESNGWCEHHQFGNPPGGWKR